MNTMKPESTIIWVIYIAVRMFIENQSRGTHLEDVCQMSVPFITAD